MHRLKSSACLRSPSFWCWCFVGAQCVRVCVMFRHQKSNLVESPLNSTVEMHRFGPYDQIRPDSQTQARTYKWSTWIGPCRATLMMLMGFWCTCGITGMTWIIGHGFLYGSSLGKSVHTSMEPLASLASAKTIR